MKAIGVTRKVDKLGRISLPKELRNSFGISVGDPVEMYYDGDLLYVKKYTPECFFCESMESVTEYRDKYICEKCLEELKKL